VTIEAAYLGKPVVSFNSGGVKEFIREGMGIVVDSWNDCDLIQAMLRVMNRDIPFDAALAKSRAAEFSVDVQGKRWLDLLTNYFAG
jgi:glycosyltransferase involved in cell wall biosynthesis